MCEKNEWYRSDANRRLDVAAKTLKPSDIVGAIYGSAAAHASVEYSVPYRLGVEFLAESLRVSSRVRRRGCVLQGRKMILEALGMEG